MAGRMTDEARYWQGRVGNHARWGRLEEAQKARTALAVARAEADLADLIEGHAPTAEQLARLATVLSSPMKAAADERTSDDEPGTPTGSVVSA